MRQGPRRRRPYNVSIVALRLSGAAMARTNGFEQMSSQQAAALRAVGILLAAGSGSRFGGDKLLAALPDGVPVGVQSLRNLRTAIADVIVVTRPQDDALRALLRDEGARIEICPRAHEGMGVSLAHGIRAAIDADAWIVALGDMPRIGTAAIRAVAAALQAGAIIAAPVYRGERGHPVGFAGALRDALRALSGDAGARDILRAERARMTLIDCDDPGVLADVDTRDDLTRISHDR